MDVYSLGRRLKVQRKAKGLTLGQLSEMSGVSPSHLGRIERGERFPSAPILRRLAEPLSMTETELFKLAGFLSRDDSDGRVDTIKKELRIKMLDVLKEIDAL